MRLQFALLTLLLLIGVSASAQRADERYVGIYNLIQQADALAENEHLADAAKGYEQARAKLSAFQAAYPRWNEKIVKYRLEYLQSRINALGPQEPEPTPDPVPAEPNEGGKVVIAPGMTLVNSNRLMSLENEIRSLRQQNVTLDAKLREALAPKPASVDPNELIKSRQLALRLEKERDLLQVTLNQARAVIPAVDPTVMKAEQAVLARVREELAEQMRISEQLRKENLDLRAKLENAAADPDVALELQLANAVLASLRSTNIALRTETLLLQDKFERAVAETDEGDSATLADLNARIAVLSARVQAYEAEDVPYSPEELALFKQKPLTATVASEGNGASKPSYSVPAGAETMIADAQKASAAGDFAAAEKAYLKVLEQDEKNLYVLGNLAATQIDQGKLTEAEKNLNTALAVAPNDASTLFVLGMLKYQQGAIDESLNALSLSVKSVPNDARTQFFLGKLLVEKGSRRPAEAALRKAISIRPEMLQAHHLLAVLYASQEPPFTELAQWHYDKAVDGGYPEDALLKKKLEDQSGQ